MAIDRRAADLVRSLDEHELRRLVILARGRLQSLGVPAFGDQAGARVTFRQQRVRCGKSTCSRCPHGPYWYAVWREGTKVRTRYIGKTLPVPDADTDLNG